jgi:F0F1-type ATP synthase membrane subunit b/b'
MEDHRDEADRYLEIVKSPGFKLWEENPGVNPPDDAMQRQIAFVEAFRADPDYRAESARRARYNAISDWFNVIMLTILVVVLARGPIANFVSGMVVSERERIESVERKRSAAARRKSEAERKLEQLVDERKKADKHVAVRISEEAAEIERLTDDALRQVRQEAEDRRRHELLQAQRRLKAMVADEAIAILEKRYRNEQSPEQNAALIDQFLQDLGGRA